MSPPAAAESATELSATLLDEHGSDIESNDFQDQRSASKRSYDSDDKETQAARENLKHATISDKEPVQDADVSVVTEPDQPGHERNDDGTTRRMTPEPQDHSGSQDEEMR